MKIFDEWIEDYNSRHESVRGRCAEATQEMVEVFQNLKRVRGHVHVTSCDKPQEHWWCVTNTGMIVDPTEKQFGGLIFKYEPWDESQPEPIGKCRNCGAYCYERMDVCSDKCAREVKARIQRGDDF